MGPIHIDSVTNLLVQVSRELKEHGWALVCTEYEGHPYQFTVGLETYHAHPELEVLGLHPDLGQQVLTHFVERVRSGTRLCGGEFFSDILKGYDLFIVENPLDPDGPPITGGRLRVVWPDANHRYPWHADCDPYCATQGMLLEPEGIDRHGLAVLLRYSGRPA